MNIDPKTGTWSRVETTVSGVAPHNAPAPPPPPPPAAPAVVATKAPEQGKLAVPAASSRFASNVEDPTAGVAEGEYTFIQGS